MRRRYRRQLLLAALALANLTYAVSQTMVIPSLPTIRDRFDATAAGATAVMTAFFLAGAITAAVIGRSGDMYGKRRTLLVQLGIFIVGAATCALAPNLVVLIAGRVLMGTAASLFPLTAAIARDEVPRELVGRAIAGLGAVLGLGTAIGLLAGGLIVDHIGLQWIFWIAAVMAVLAMTAVVLVVPESPAVWPGRQDPVGAVLLALGLSMPLLGITFVSTRGLMTVTVLIAAGIVCLGLFYRHLKRHPEPLVDLRTLSSKRVATINATTFMVGFGIFGPLVILSQFFQEPKSSGYGAGANATQNALFLMPGTAAMLLTAPFAGRLSARFGAKVTLLTGCGLATVSLLLVAFAHGRTIELYLCPIGWYTAVGVSLGAIPTLILETVPRDQRAQSTAMNQIFRLSGSSVGIQVAATLVSISAVHGSKVPRESGYVHAFLCEAIGAAAAFGLALAIPARRARAARGEPPPLPAVV
jgi:MFS family permease